MDRYDIYSREGRLLGSVATQEKAEQLLGTWYSAQFVLKVAPDGTRTIVVERKEAAY